MRVKKFFQIVFLILFSLSCSFFSRLVNPQPTSKTSTPALSAEQTEPIQPASGQGSFSPITFCEDVTDSGEPVNPSTSFPADTMQVWAYFTYEGMQDGQAWSRVWEQDGDLFYEARGEAWGDGESGWVAYSISDDKDIPLDGQFTLTLYIGDAAVQQGSFEVAAPEKTQQITIPAFGPIQFAKEITAERAPVGPANQFEPGTYVVYAVFPYANLGPDQVWGKEWVQNGEVIAKYEGAWGTPSEGITYLNINGPEDGSLAAGSYTLNLYLDGQLARSASFDVLSAEPTQVSPGKPEELIHADLLQAWQILYDAQDKYSFLHDTAQFVLDRHIQINMDEGHEDNVLGYYHLSGDMCQPNYSPGSIGIYRDYWNNNSWEAVASVLAHEITHAQQHYSGDYRCPGCSIYAEYWARIAEFYTLLMLNRQDLIYNWPVFDSNGKFSPDLVWSVTKEIYGDSCPEY
jgi:hypothetical protein